MSVVEIVLVVSTLLCSLVAGLVFAFAVVIMPGIRVLDDRDFLRAFKVMDKVIQDNQPVFLIVWLGSAVAIIVFSILAIWNLEGVNRILSITLSAVYLLGVQLPTITINIPLNNKLQSLDLQGMTATELQHARQDFEPRWNLWNMFRTVLATLVTLGLICLTLRI